MENIDDKIKRFLAVSYGYGDGSGDGSGYGDGDGDGDGSGDGDGDGSGDGSGYGDGSGSGSGYGSGSGSGDGYGDGDGYGSGDGYGDGLKQYEGRKVYYIDGIATLIDQVCVSYARGFAINGDLTLSACYIAREGNFFAHGDTLREAAEAAHRKWMEQRPLSDRIGDFVAQHPSLETICSFEDLFEWHHVLTGSCEYGRRKFAADNGLKEGDTLTVAAFITLTRNAYGSDAIQQLEKAYRNQDKTKQDER